MLCRLMAILRSAAFLGLGMLWASGSEPVGRMPWQEYGLEQGLRNVSIWSICQDRRGFLWVGTEDGLHRYDGNRFEVFTRGLPSDQILCLLADAEGGLWVGTYRGLARWEGTRFLTVGKELSELTGPVHALAFGPGGALWVGTAKGLLRQLSGDRFEVVPSWPGGAVSAMTQLPGKEELSLASWDGTRARLFQGGKASWQELSGPAGFGKERLDALAMDGGGILWARSLGALWKTKNNRLQRVDVLAKNARQRAALHADAKGRVWVPSDSELLTLDRDKTTRLTSKEGWPRRVVRTAFVDREGSLWVGGEGLRRTKGRGLWRSYGIEEGLQSPYVWSLFRDRNRTLYAGTERGLARLDSQGWKTIQGTEDTQVRSIVQGADGAFYLAGSPWILRWDPRTGLREKFGPEDGVRANGRIFRLLFDRQGTLWVATDSGGLLRGRANGGRWTFVPESLPGGTPKESIEDLHEDSEGRLWVSGVEGIALREQGAWRRFTSRDGLRKDAVAYTRSLRNGELIVAYFDNIGMARARFEQGRFRVLEHFDALLDPTRLVYLVGEDARGNLWAGCGRGVDLVTPDRKVEHFSYAAGLVFDNTNNMAFLAEPNGDVWIGTTDGLGRFDGSSYEGPPPAPLLEVLYFTLGTERFSAIPGKPPQVPFRGNTFEARFAALAFSHGGDLRLEVRLSGLEDDWHSAHGFSERYAGLPAGDYSFQIRSRIGSGAWTFSTPVLFTVLRPWWSTWTFRLLAGLGLIGLAVFYFRWRMRHLKALNLALEEKVRERTLALDASEKRAWDAFSQLQVLDDQKNQFIGIVAHDLRSPLSGIVLAADLIQEEEDPEVRNTLAKRIAKQGIEMSQLITRFLDFAALESGRVKPESTDFSLVEVAKEVFQGHQARAFEKGIELILEPTEGEFLVFADVKFTKAILDNLVSNAIKYTPSGKGVWMRLEPKSEGYRFSVEDQGPGITEVDQAKLFQRFKRLSAVPTGGESSTGLGLSIVKHMADAMGCRLEVESHPGEGATFRVTFPFTADGGSPPPPPSRG